MHTRIKDISQTCIGKKVTINGWVRSTRDQQTITFININDGSTVNGMQVVAEQNLPNYDTIIKKLLTGTSATITGTVVQSPGKGQTVEIKAEAISIIGECPEDYPLQKKRHTFEYLRTIAHLRPRTNTFGAVTRVRHALAMATHRFFDEQGFVYINTPIITSSDCEGAGQMFRVSTLDMNKPPRTQEGNIDNSQDFFEKPTFLTVSGQLEGEAYACALSNIYTFGPTFRAENSNTSRHLAEFWMIEPEIAFANLTDDMDCAEAYLKYCIKYVLEHCPQDMTFFDSFIEKGLIQRLTHVLETPFERLEYTRAVDILLNCGKTFQYPVFWGVDLQSEHERYLVEEVFKKPVILHNYPATIKPFYMRINDDGTTVANMDILVSGVGEIIGGSQREERLDVLERRMTEMGMKYEDYWWYIELRKYGSVPHAGFGLGFERLIQFTTGMENIRDVIPFPRYPGHAEF
jgi:asparaginyl-tRNA synthetase